MNIWLPSYLSLSLCRKCWGEGVKGGGGRLGGFRERKTEWVMVRVSDRESTVLKTRLPKTERQIAAKHYTLSLNYWLCVLDHLATRRCLKSDFMHLANHIAEGPKYFDRSGDHVNTTNYIESVNQYLLGCSVHAIWGRVIWNGRALTDLGSGVGQRRAPLWSNMAYLTGLGSGRVQSTAALHINLACRGQCWLK